MSPIDLTLYLEADSAGIPVYIAKHQVVVKVAWAAKQIGKSKEAMRQEGMRKHLEAFRYDGEWYYPLRNVEAFKQVEYDGRYKENKDKGE